jgi:hypothetical protein
MPLDAGRTRTYVRSVADADWALLRTCATDVVEQARQWWPAAPATARSRVADPLGKLAEQLAFLRQRDEVLARPGAPMARDALLRNVRAVVLAIRINCPPDASGMPLWTACARLAFAVARLEDLGHA